LGPIRALTTSAGCGLTGIDTGAWHNYFAQFFVQLSRRNFGATAGCKLIAIELMSKGNAAQVQLGRDLEAGSEWASDSQSDAFNSDLGGSTERFQAEQIFIRRQLRYTRGSHKRARRGHRWSRSRAIAADRRTLARSGVRGGENSCRFMQ